LTESFKYIETSVTNIYACKQATPSSNTKIANKNKNGKITIIWCNLHSTRTKSAKICTKIWPAIILALNLIAKLKDLKI